MSRTKIEQYPNSLMTVSKLLSKRMERNMPVIVKKNTNEERNEFYKNKEQYKNNIDEILNKINDIDVYIDELKTIIKDIFIPISQPSGILRKIIQDLTLINKNYKNNIIKKSKYYNLYDLQEIENDIKTLSEKYSILYTSPEIQAYLQNNEALEPLLERTNELFKGLIKITEQVSQKQEINILPSEQRGEQYVGGYLTSISDSLASKYRIK